jgi:glycerol-3-phosphate dehydrogenase
MQRDLNELAARPFDILIVGAGAFGAAAAWDAALRGLKVALIDRRDFGSGASAECFKMVHGGIRYLQHADIRRLRFSCAQRSALLKIAPHLVNPLPIVVPTYGHGRQGKPFLAAGMFAYDLLTAGKNSGIRDPSRRIAGTELLSRNQLLDLFPELEQRALTGGAVFQDGQMYNAARLVLAFVKSAVSSGAVAANYVEALNFIWEGRRVCGVRARDCVGTAEFDIRATLVLNAAGPWAEYLLHDPEHFAPQPRGHFSRDACFLVNRKPRSKYALAVPGWAKDSDALVSRAARHLFAVPWRDCTLIGVWHRLFPERPDTARVEESELAAWIEEMNASYPALRLRRDDVIYANCGLVPFGDGGAEAGELTFGKESRFLDHRLQGIDGLVTLIGIRYTTARGDAAKALDLLLEQWPGTLRPAPTAEIPLAGGDIADFQALQASARRAVPQAVSARTLNSWLRNYGTEYRDLAELAGSPALAQRLGESDTLQADVTYSVREEMAVRLADVILRRTELGSGSHPGRAAIAAAARGMQQLLGWSDAQREEEIADTERELSHHRASEPDKPSAEEPRPQPPRAEERQLLSSVPVSVVESP